MSKTSRNDPCPCGSGKKYKHCYLGAQDWVQPKELAKVWLTAFPSIPGDYGIDPTEQPKPGQYFSGFDELTRRATPYAERIRVTPLFKTLFRPPAGASTPELPTTR